MLRTRGAAMAALSGRAPLDKDDVEPLGLSLLELEEEEVVDHIIGDLTIPLRGFPRSSGQTLQCTGETTWRGGDLLARHLWQRRATTDAVVELGSGLGLVALAAQMLEVAPVIVATDGDERALDKLRRNVAPMRVERLRWGDAEDVRRVLAHSEHGFSLVLGADVAYTPEAVAPLARTCRALLAPGGEVVIAYTRRHVDAEAVLEAFADEGLVMRRDALRDAERSDTGDRVWYFSLVELELSSEDEEEPWAFDVADAAEALLKDGFVVVENATRSLAATLRSEVLSLAEFSLLRASPNALRTSAGREVRAKTNVEELQIHAKGAPILDDAAVTAARSLCPTLRDFGGREARVLGSKLAAKLGVRLTVDEVKAAVHGEGGCFPAHLDTTDATGRCVTAILYLSEGVKGGELRVYPSSGGAPVDVTPALGTLVLFSSTATLHRTLPLRRGQRPLVSFWFASPTPLLADRTATNKLVRLLHAGDYTGSFRDAFPRDAARDDALALFAGANAAAEAALNEDERATLDAWRRRLASAV